MKILDVPSRAATALGALLVLTLPPCALTAASGTRSQSLFNGHDLTGWVPVNVAPDTFVVRDGLIVCRGSPAGYLATATSYQNFEFELEWRHLQPRGNSGLLFWAEGVPAVGAPVPKAIEVQILDPAYETGRVNANRQYTTHGDIVPIRNATLTPAGRISENGKRSLPVERRVKPSPEWNHYRVECIDGSIRLFVNGAAVTRAENALPRAGRIGLQSEGSEIHFRNLRIGSAICYKTVSNFGPGEHPGNAPNAPRNKSEGTRFNPTGCRSRKLDARTGGVRFEPARKKSARVIVSWAPT